MPAAEVNIDAALVRGLLTDQHSDLAGLPLHSRRFGWDNVLFRLGDELVVRLPRRGAAATLVEHEQRWLPQLAPALPLPIPVPVRVGRPALGYPWSWSIVPWFPGETAAQRPPEPMDDAAATLGRFLAALHQPAPEDAPVNPFRGVPLAARADRFDTVVESLGPMIDRRAVLDQWRVCLEAVSWAGPALWIHGDLHPANLVVHQGRLVAVIDFGDLTASDPATDLSVAWMLLPLDSRAVFRRSVGDVDDATWIRARGWALALALVYLANSADNPMIANVGRRTLDAVLDDPTDA